MYVRIFAILYPFAAKLVALITHSMPTKIVQKLIENSIVIAATLLHTVLPLRFYVKSILGILEYQKLQFFTISELLNFDNLVDFVFKDGKKMNAIKSQSFQKCQNGSFLTSSLRKIDFT